MNLFVTKFVETELFKTASLKKKSKFIVEDDFDIDKADEIFDQFLQKQLIQIDEAKYQKFNEGLL